MAPLAEYALTPDVFDSASYSSDEFGCIWLQDLKEVLLAEGQIMKGPRPSSRFTPSRIRLNLQPFPPVQDLSKT